MGTKSVRTGHSDLNLTATLTSQSVSGNYSKVKVRLWSNVDNNWAGPSGDYGTSWSLKGPDFTDQSGSGKPSKSGDHYTWRETTLTVSHNSDGTGKLDVTGAIGATGTSSLGGPASVRYTDNLPTIAQASKPTLSSGTVDAGSAVTIYTNRKSSKFTHTLYINYSSLGKYTIATGVGSSYEWTVPLSTFASVTPDRDGTWGGLHCVTYDGSKKIGDEEVHLTIHVPNSAKPSIGSISVSEANSTIASKIGKYVQGFSKLHVTLNGVKGIYGSTIKEEHFSVASQTIHASSGTTKAINAHGNVTISARATDSRNRVATASTSVNVLAYSNPSVSTLSVARVNSGGGKAPSTGTYLAITFKTNVHSLKSGSTEKNSQTVRLYVREHGSSAAWTTLTSGTGGTSWTHTYRTGGGYSIDTAYDVMAKVTDVLGRSSTSTVTVPTAQIFMHLGSKGQGIGVGKFWEHGSIDAAGDGHFTNMYLRGTGDAGLDPYGQALTIGPVNGVNMAIDTNEIQARNNGDASSLGLNWSGGSVSIGTGAHPNEKVILGNDTIGDLTLQNDGNPQVYSKAVYNREYGAAAPGNGTRLGVVTNFGTLGSLTGAIDPDYIPGIPASKITSGTISSARLPSIDQSEITASGHYLKVTEDSDGGRIYSDSLYGRGYSNGTGTTDGATRLVVVTNAGTLGVLYGGSGATVNIGSNNLQSGEMRSHQAGTNRATVWIDGDGILGVATSARALKEDIATWQADVNLLQKINPVTFKYKADVERDGDKAETQVGFIADDFVDNGLSGLGLTFNDPETDSLQGLNYERVTPILWSLVQQQQQQIAALTDRVTALEAAAEK